LADFSNMMTRASVVIVEGSQETKQGGADRRPFPGECIRVLIREAGGA
jgi:hypothetical protein